MKLRVLTVAGFLVLPATGCLVLKPQHDDLARRVDQLQVQVAEQSKSLDETLTKAEQLEAELAGKLREAEELLRRNQADIGLRVQNLESELQALRGAADNAEYVATAGNQEIAELRTDLDARIKILEEKLNEATNIPEGKQELWDEAERQLKAGDHKQARRLWRTYLSRYPDDARLPEAKFKVGLTYFSERDYKSSLGEFYRVVQESPKSDILPDALYYSGLAFAKIGQCKNASAYFEALLRSKTKAPARYKEAANKQLDILKKDNGEICTDRSDAGAGSAAEQGMSGRKAKPAKR